MWNRLRGSRKRRVWPFKNFDRIPKDRRGSAIPDFTAVTFSTLNSTSPQKSAAEGPTALWMKEPNLFLLVEKRGTTTQAGHVRFAINTSMHAQNMSECNNPLCNVTTVFGGEASARTCQGQLFHFALGDSAQAPMPGMFQSLPYTKIESVSVNINNTPGLFLESWPIRQPFLFHPWGTNF